MYFMYSVQQMQCVLAWIIHTEFKFIQEMFGWGGGGDSPTPFAVIIIIYRVKGSVLYTKYIGSSGIH